MIQLCDGQLILFEYFLFSSLIYILCSKSPLLLWLVTASTLHEHCGHPALLNGDRIFQLYSLNTLNTLLPSLSLEKTQFTSPPRFGDNLGNRHTVSSRGCWMRQKRLGSWWGTPCPRGQTHVLCPRGSSWLAWPPAPGSQPQAWPRSARGRSQRERGRAQGDWAQAPPHWSWPGSACPEQWQCPSG